MLLKNLKFNLALILCLFSNLLLADNLNIGDKLQKKFNENFYKLKPIKQSHYAIRLYRITGKRDYLYPIISYQFIERMHLERLVREIPSSTLEKFDVKSIYFPPNYEQLSKQEKRKLLLTHCPGISNALNILIILDHAQQLSTLNSTLFPQTEIAMDHLRKNIDFLRSFLLDPTVIKTSSAQVVNFVYILNRLQLIDLRKEYIEQFKSVFSDQEDDNLDDRMFEDKIYGMTHIIFAASEYYQKQLSYEEFKWVSHYFDENIDRILAKTNPDIIAEVGITYRLLNKNKHSSALSRIENYLQNQFDPEIQRIRGRPGLDNLNMAEHRNVLAIMLFKWPTILHPGPNIENTESLLNILQPIQPL